MNPGLLTIAQPHFYESEEQRFTITAMYTFQLPLARLPHGLRAVLVCKVTESGYPVGYEIDAVNLFSGALGLAGLTVASYHGVAEVLAYTGLSVRNRSNPGNVPVELNMPSFAIKVYAIWPPLT